MITIAALLLALAAQQKPNVVLILTDDLDATLGTLDHLPNYKRLLLDQGLEFRRSYVAYPLCCPSRTSLLRGQYAHSHQVYTNAAPSGGYAKFLQLGYEQTNLATLLSAAGYRTALLGKYLNGYAGREAAHVPPGWTEWASPTNGGYAQYNYTLNVNGKLEQHGRAPGDYLQDILTRRALDFMRASRAAGQPFFLEIASFAPHGPATPAPRHEALLPDLRAPRTKSFSLNARAAAAIDSQYRKRVLSLLAVDEMIEQIVNELSASGQLANTHIVFTSDNGFHLGQHGLRQGKNTPFEEDIRVPLVWRGPGIAAGSKSDALVVNVDLLPTFLELAGVAIPGFVEGRSLTPLFRNAQSRDWRQVVLSESYFGNQPDAPTARPRARRRANQRTEARLAWAALRTERYTFVRRANGQFELYDNRTDPDQLINLAGTFDRTALQSFEQWLRALGSCAGAACRRIEEQWPAGIKR